jgi:hypothetical protein
MAITLNCECGKKLSAKDEHAGKNLRCPVCRRGITIPPLVHEAGERLASSPLSQIQIEVENSLLKPSPQTRHGRLRDNQTSIIACVLGCVLLLSSILYWVSTRSARTDDGSDAPEGSAGRVEGDKPLGGVSVSPDVVNRIPRTHLEFACELATLDYGDGCHRTRQTGS